MKYRLSSTSHLLTIDVMDWHQDPTLRRVPDDGAAAVGDRAGAAVDRVLESLAHAGARATFFITQSVARRDPTVARRIVSAGHEVAARGEVANDDANRFRWDAKVARDAIEHATGALVRGFRAPRAAEHSAASWRFDVLIEEGYEYESSRVAGYPQTVVCGAGSIVEVPLMSHPVSRDALSIRRASYSTVRRAFVDRTRAGLPGLMAFASWEIDDAQPKVRLPLVAGLRHYSGRRAALERVARLLGEFRFDAVGNRLGELSQAAPFTYAA